MPRPKKPGAPEPKRRSRNGCWNCKGRKIKCDERKPTCVSCQRNGETCDYSVRLNWESRRIKKQGVISFGNEKPLPSPTEPQRPFMLYSHTFTVPEGTVPQFQRVEHQPLASPEALSPRGQSSFTPYQEVTETIEQERGTWKRRLDDSQPRDGPGRDTTTDVTSLKKESGIASHAIPLGLGGPMGQASQFVATSPHDPEQTSASFQKPHKRTKSEQFEPETARQPLFPSPASLTGSSPPATRFYPGPGIINIGDPLTPAASSSYSDDDPRPSMPQAKAPSGSPNVRRLSVSSLLSGPPGPVLGPTHRRHESGAGTPLALPPPAEQGVDWSETASFYGYDLGEKDMDLGKNDDASAIARTPPGSREHTATPLSSQNGDFHPVEFGFRVQSSCTNSGASGYYDKPVPIRIPRNLEPLPSKLQDNPMNLLYFHHFLDHTARVLVPYDDPQSNPFRIILPQMAVKNDNLLSLLLAYSASHRARLLKQREPAMRIALWVEDIFPALRQALNDKQARLSNANLATAIMLASLEIISPTAFGYDIPWQKHLSLARELMKKRLADLRRFQSNSIEDQICSFLWSWFAYLDVLGSLSGGPRYDNDSSSAWLLDYGINDIVEDQDEIDCIMGFTTRCVHLLAQTAELARQCDSQRIGPDNRVIRDWNPPHETVQRAGLLDHDLRDSLQQPTRPCKHIHAGIIDGRDRAEMGATNAAFHWAGLVHLHRRVLGKPSDHIDVQGPVENIIRCMESIRPGGTAETGFLFPMFTAGCDTRDSAQRALVLERFKSMEKSGMTQVNRARRLMEKVWETGQLWETLLSTEFIG